MRQEKQLLLDEIKELIDDSSAIVFARYQRMNPNMASNFRMKIGQSGGVFEVVRKRILIKAAEAAGLKLDPEALQGHIGVIFVKEDPIQVTKTVYQFSGEHEDVLHVLAGHFEGRFCSAKDVEQISKLPSKDEMRAQFLGLLEAPMAQTLSVMEALLTSVMYCLENKSGSESESNT
jgi:large subunit ribosomal protein L10